ncbi:hypothetical protein KEM48_003177 [Puccinia striiformis f. sp. tritici PST-130]|nr:hypothetical protein KEM48_003177 [Puccinia striiformis f. sp. tritici PST-130]
MSLRVRLTMLAILGALVGLIHAGCPIDKPNLWCGTTAGSSATKDCRRTCIIINWTALILTYPHPPRLSNIPNACLKAGPGRRGPGVKCCVEAVLPDGPNDNVDCKYYAQLCTSY